MAKILIVDDSLLLRNIIKNEVSYAGHEIVGEAVNGKEGVALYEQHRPDIVTMDITMDEMNGLEAAEAILKKYPSAKVIMVTALDEEDVMKQAVKLGVKDFIVKPFVPERLLSAIEKAL